MATTTTTPMRTCEAMVDDDSKPIGLKICRAPATNHIVDRTGDTADEYDCCVECTPWQEPMDRITVEPIEESAEGER